VVNKTSFGVFVDFLPGCRGLCHVTELSKRLLAPESYQIGDSIDVKLLEVRPLFSPLVGHTDMQNSCFPIASTILQSTACAACFSGIVLCKASFRYQLRKLP
jgi:hypothetical protein